jgi:DNA-binding GntR family transcriptional regulator
VTTTRRKHGELLDLVAEHLPADRPIKTGELRETCGIGGVQVGQALRRLEAQGQARRVSYGYWQAVDKGNGRPVDPRNAVAEVAGRVRELIAARHDAEDFAATSLHLAARHLERAVDWLDGAARPQVGGPEGVESSPAANAELERMP